MRPVVHGCTQKYSGKSKLGRGFSLAELKEAKLSAKFARTVGIAVDHRRHNKSADGQALNVARLVEYKKKLVVFPRKENKPKKGEIDDFTGKVGTTTQSPALWKLPAAPVAAPVFEPLTKAMKEGNAAQQGRDLWLEKRDHGRKKRKAEIKAAAKK